MSNTGTGPNRAWPDQGWAAQFVERRVGIVPWLLAGFAAAVLALAAAFLINDQTALAVVFGLMAFASALNALVWRKVAARVRERNQHA